MNCASLSSKTYSTSNPLRDRRALVNRASGGRGSRPTVRLASQPPALGVGPAISRRCNPHCHAPALTALNARSQRYRFALPIASAAVSICKTAALSIFNLNRQLYNFILPFVSAAISQSDFLVLTNIKSKWQPCATTLEKASASSGESNLCSAMRCKTQRGALHCSARKPAELLARRRPHSSIARQ